jgi:hypothetical protein
LKGRLNQGLAISASNEAPARDFPGSPSELVKRQVAVEILRERFLHPLLCLTKSEPVDDVRCDKERGDKSRNAEVDPDSPIHASRPQWRE